MLLNSPEFLKRLRVSSAAAVRTRRRVGERCANGCATGSKPICDGPDDIRSTPMIRSEKQCLALNHIHTGKLQQTAYVARYNWTVRHEWLAPCIVDTVEEGQRWHYARPEIDDG